MTGTKFFDETEKLAETHCEPYVNTKRMTAQEECETSLFAFTVSSTIYTLICLALHADVLQLLRQEADILRF